MQTATLSPEAALLLPAIEAAVRHEMALPEGTALHPALRLQGEAINADELDVLAVLITLEGRFRVEIADEEVDIDPSLGDLAEMLARKGCRP